MVSRGVSMPALRPTNVLFGSVPPISAFALYGQGGYSTPVSGVSHVALTVTGPVAPAADLVFVHPTVGALDELFGRLRARLGVGGEPHGELDPVRPSGALLPESSTQALHDLRRLIAVAGGEDQEELVSAEAAEEVSLPDGLPRRPAELDDQAVPLRVAVAVVDRLQAVEVQVGDGGGARRSAAPGRAPSPGPRTRPDG